jgi:hypothetical protein
MSGALRPAGEPGRRARLTDRIGAALLIAVAGFVLGQQLLSPNKRVIPVITAILLFGLAWRADMAASIGLLMIVLPFARFTTFGNTNLAFVLILLVIWLLRITLRRSSPPSHTPADAPLIVLFVCYVLSLYNVEPAELPQNLQMLTVMVGCWLMFYLIMSNLRTPRDFQRVFVFQAISVFSVCLIALYEVTHPGSTLIQGLFRSSHALTAGQASLSNLRVGSIFLDYELLCEYCALNLLLVLFLLARSRSLLPRLAYGGLALFVVFVLFTTVTRGGLIALAIGVLYLMWLIRRRLTFVGVTVGLAMVVLGALAMNAYVVSSTHSGNLLERLSTSEVSGLVPDTRKVVWSIAWERIFQHPLIGHGPSYSLVSGGRLYYWPHSLYLFVANNVGFIGLAVMVWLLWTLFQMTRPVTDDLQGGDYVGSYLIVARAQMLVFLVDQIKIEYLRNTTYQFQVWLMFGLMAAAYQALQAAGAPSPARGQAPRA